MYKIVSASGYFLFSTVMEEIKPGLDVIGEVFLLEQAICNLLDNALDLTPDTGKKSTGLGLNFVEEIMKLHHGQLVIENAEGGVSARVTLPAVVS